MTPHGLSILDTSTCSLFALASTLTSLAPATSTLQKQPSARSLRVSVSPRQRSFCSLLLKILGFPILMLLVSWASAAYSPLGFFPPLWLLLLCLLRRLHLLSLAMKEVCLKPHSFWSLHSSSLWAPLCIFPSSNTIYVPLTPKFTRLTQTCH